MLSVISVVYVERFAIVGYAGEENYVKMMDNFGNYEPAISDNILEYIFIFVYVIVVYQLMFQQN